MTTGTKYGLACTTEPKLAPNGQISYIPHCAMNEKCEAKACGRLPRAIKKGDEIHVEMLYQQDDKPHFGVMGFSVLMIHRTDYVN